MMKLHKTILFSLVILSLLFTASLTRPITSARSSPHDEQTYSMTLDTSSKDTYVESGSQMDANEGASLDLYFGFIPSGDRVLRVLVQFDLPPTLSGVYITSATLKLWGPWGLSGGSPAGETLRACRVTHDWVEGTGEPGVPNQDGATWNEYDYWDGLATATHNWGTQGGDYTLTDSSTVIVPPQGTPLGYLSWTVTNIVEGWASGTYSNCGFLIKLDNEPGVFRGGVFPSREYAEQYGVYYAPKLEITYTTFGLENVTAWYWYGDTQIESVARGNVDGDGDVEIVTGGHYYDGIRDVAQLCVWNGATFALENVKCWYWGDFAEIYSVAVGDVDGDGSIEILTGGFYYDGVRHHAQLCVWSGATLALEGVRTWYWTDSTVIYSVAVGDVDGDGSVEIVSGGSHSDGAYSNAQLCVWSGSTLALKGVKTWHWISDTYISSVVLGDVDGDESVEIVTGGYHDDGVRWNAQLCVWSGSTLMLEDVTTWYWTDYTIISSVTAADVDGDSSIEIVTGGNHNDGTRNNAQLCVWDGSALTLENVKTWYWTGATGIYSVVVNDVDGDGSVEIVTGGYYWDGTRTNAQLCVWSGSTLVLEDVTAWYWTGDTIIYSVTVGVFGVDGSSEIVTGGYFFDGTRDNAQLTAWA